MAVKLVRDIDVAFVNAGDRPDAADDAADLLLVGEIPDLGAPAIELPPDAYYIGSFVVREVEPRLFEVFDGLQRLTTLTILFAVLRDLEEDPAAWAVSHDLILAADGPRLALATREPVLLDHVQEGGATRRARRITAATATGQRVQEVKNALLAELAPWEPGRRTAFAAFLRRAVLASVVHVREPQMGRQVFLSTNVFGKRLAPVDLLKGQLSDLGATDDASAEIVARWDALRDGLGADFEPFLLTADAMTRRVAQQDTWPTDLGQHLANVGDPGHVLRYFVLLERLAAGWRELREILAEGGPTDPERDLWRLSCLPWTEWRPVALWIWDQLRAAGGDRRDRFARVAQRLHRRSIGWLLAGATEAERRRLFARALTQLAAGRDPTVSGRALVLTASARDRVALRLAAPLEPDLARTLLVWLEAAAWRDGLPAQLAAARVAALSDVEILGDYVLVPEELERSDLRAALRPAAERLWTLRSAVEPEAWTPVAVRARHAALVERVWALLG